mgnify:FL=1
MTGDSDGNNVSFAIVREVVYSCVKYGQLFEELKAIEPYMRPQTVRRTNLLVEENDDNLPDQE